MKKKEEILEVFDISTVISVTQRNIFEGIAALTEVLCDIRDGLNKSPISKRLKRGERSLYRIPHDDYDPDSLPKPPGKDGKWDD